jgi:hypothetical protein
MLVATSVAGCGAAIRPFADREVVWQDDDREPFAPMPEAERSRAVWDAADGLFFRAADDALAVTTPTESVDVNALDEVPSSSFFENRIGLAPMTPEEVALGSCADDREPTAPFPWRVIDVKRDGVQPGFEIVDAAGVRHVVKLDSLAHPERSTAADVVVAAMLSAAGYHVPCNRIVHFDPADLVIDDGDDAPSREALEHVLARARRIRPEGAIRASASRYLPGRPLGPWSYVGRWSRDPNDRVPHELRREVRALRYFFAWVDHVDARAHNTLAIWIDEGGGRGHVRHALLDFGDSLGATSTDARRSARYGHAHWIDLGLAVEDVITLGLVPRPWYRERVATDPVIGDFRSEPFDPDGWRANYRNGAFEHADAGDAAWAARIIARFTEAHLRALAALGRLEAPGASDALASALISRRNAILERHLTALSPLTRPVIAESGSALCLEDLAVSGEIRASEEREDAAWIRDREGRRGAALAVTRRGARVCAALPPAPQRAGYLVIDVVTGTAGRDRPGPARVHLLIDERGARVLGLERPERGDA